MTSLHPAAQLNHQPQISSVAPTTNEVPGRPATNEAPGRGGGELTIDSLQVELQRRDVQTPVASLLQTCSLEQIARTVDWWDHISSGAGPGVLVEAIRKGGVSEQRRGLDSQRRYGERICDWLNEHFPEFSEASGIPHPAAIGAVIGLHYEHGKGSLTPGRHGAQIRSAVKAWARRYESADGDFTESELELIRRRRAVA